MNSYYIFTGVLAIVILPVCFWLNEAQLKYIRVSVRIATLMMMLVYPWDFFAIQLHSWGYPHDPGVRLYGVPFNDLVFTWLCSVLGASILFSFARRHAQR
jgi:lycopene cyclase domain-containing protein